MGTLAGTSKYDYAVELIQTGLQVNNCTKCSRTDISLLSNHKTQNSKSGLVWDINITAQPDMPKTYMHKLAKISGWGKEKKNLTYHLPQIFCNILLKTDNPAKIKWR